MWIENLPDGRFKFRERYKDPLTGKSFKVSVTVAKNTTHTRKEAQIKLDKKITEILKSIQYGKIKHGIHLKELNDEWLPTYKLEVRANTYSNAESRLRRVMRDIKPDTLIEKITPNYLTNYFNNLLYKQNLKNGTVSHIKQTLNVMFDYAVLHDYLKENPIQKVKIRYRKEDGSAKPRDKFLEEDELKKVLEFEYQAGNPYGRFCEFLYLTGLRYGEAAALTPDDIKENKAVISGTLIKLPREAAYKQNSTKTTAGMRTITLPQRALEIIEKQRQEFPDSKFLFCTKRKDFIPEVTLNHQLRRAKEKFKIDKKVDCHIFRHTHVSKLAELGIPLYVIQDHVGHADDKTTNLIYLHVTKKAQQKLDSQLDKL